MALTFNNFCGFETGGLEEASATSGTPDPTEATIVRTGVRSLEMLEKATPVRTYTLPIDDGITSAGNDHIFGFGVYFTDLSPETSPSPLVTDDQNNFTLELTSGGDLEIRDQSNVLQATAAAPFIVNTWHFIEFYWEQAAPTTVVLELFVDGNSVATVATGKSFNSSTPTGYVLQSPLTNGGTYYYDDIYILTGATSADDRLSNGSADPFFEAFGHQTTKASATPDAGMVGNTGTDLDAGNWADAGNTPVNDATSADYTASTVDQGTVDLTLDPGVDGDSNIRAMKGIWRGKRAGGSGSIYSAAIGNSGDGNDIGTTGPVVGHAVTTAPVLTTTEQNFILPINSDLPTASETIRQGIGKDDGGRDWLLHEMWAMIAHVPAGAVVADVFDPFIPPQFLKPAIIGY